MTQSSHDTFVDRRTAEEVENGLATQILFWYDEDHKKRRRVNGVAVTTDGYLFVASSTCSKKDQFEKWKGRMILSNRIFGNAQKHCRKLIVPPTDLPSQMALAIADVYEQEFPDDVVGKKRAYNAGKIYINYLADIERRAQEMEDDFEYGQPNA